MVTLSSRKAPRRVVNVKNPPSPPTFRQTQSGISHVISAVQKQQTTIAGDRGSVKETVRKRQRLGIEWQFRQKARQDEARTRRKKRQVRAFLLSSVVKLLTPSGAAGPKRIRDFGRHVGCQNTQRPNRIPATAGVKRGHSDNNNRIAGPEGSFVHVIRARYSLFIVVYDPQHLSAARVTTDRSFSVG